LFGRSPLLTAERGKEKKQRLLAYPPDPKELMPDSPPEQLFASSLTIQPYWA
jgi:hypothetical protein